MKKLLTTAAIIVGTALLVICVAVPAYVVPRGKVLPKDIDSHTVTDPVGGIVLDSAALAAGRPAADRRRSPECAGDTPRISCFIATDVPLQSRTQLTAREPSSRKQVTVEATTELTRTDAPADRASLGGTVDRVTLDRETRFPVNEPVSTLTATDPTGTRRTETPRFIRSGLDYRFPADTEKKAYPYFDTTVLRNKDIDFVDEEKRDGETVYRFEQTVDPTEMYPALEAMLRSDGSLSDGDREMLDPLRHTAPAAAWGLDRAEVPGWSATDPRGPDVRMSRYYTVNRTVLVQPDTGIIVDDAEDVWVYYARDDAEARRFATPERRGQELRSPRRTVLEFPARWDRATQDEQMALAKDGLRALAVGEEVIPWAAGILGVLALVAAWAGHRPRRGARG